MSDIVFEDPPDRDRRGVGRPSTTFTQEVRNALDARPGEWARVEQDVSRSRANAWGSAAHFQRRRGEPYQIAIRTVDGVRTVYARREEG